MEHGVSDECLTGNRRVYAWGVDECWDGEYQNERTL